MRAASTKPDSRSSSNSVAGMTMKEMEMHCRKTQHEHILLRPDTFVSSIQKHSRPLWVYEGGAMVIRDVEYVPGLYKIFDDILVNAAGNKQRDPSMDSLRVDIDVEGCCISVYNNGDGLPVEIHPAEGIYMPEMICGHLHTSGNDTYDVKLTNVLSMEFVIYRDC